MKKQNFKVFIEKVGENLYDLDWRDRDFLTPAGYKQKKKMS